MPPRSASTARRRGPSRPRLTSGSAPRGARPARPRCAARGRAPGGRPTAARCGGSRAGGWRRRPASPRSTDSRPRIPISAWPCLFSFLHERGARVFVPVERDRMPCRIGCPHLDPADVLARGVEALSEARLEIRQRRLEPPAGGQPRRHAAVVRVEGHRHVLPRRCRLILDHEPGPALPDRRQLRLAAGGEQHARHDEPEPRSSTLDHRKPFYDIPMRLRRLARRVIGTAGIALAGSGASAQPAPPAQATAPTAQISGVVKRASDDAPIGRARVSAAADALPEPRVTLSGADGKYALTDLPAGSYTVSVTRTGYAPQTYSRGRSITPTSIVLTSTQQVAGLDFALVPAGFIAGRILDEDGSPFAGALVDALVTRSENGTDTLFSVASSQTDDRVA